MKKLFVLLLTLAQTITFGQGYNHQWLLGNYSTLASPKGRMTIDSNGYSLLNENRKMPFYGTQGNISDANGNILMYSNGVWIANALNDTMLNGSGINPGGATPNWPYGLPMISNNIFLIYPGDSTRYGLFHHTASVSPGAKTYELYYSEIDMALDSGRGAVTTKNLVILADTLGGGIGACRHANGKDWWVVIMEDGSDAVYKVLLTNTGISGISKQNIGYSPYPIGNLGQITFNNDGTQLIATTYDNPNNRNSFLIIADFDRCTGQFSNTQTVQLASGSYLWGLAFSPSGNYAYACTEANIFQVDVNTLTVDTVATYDGFVSPGPSCCATTFWNMYLAANGKIYVTSGSSVRHFTEINYPDSAGLACDVQQHAVFIGNYAHLRSVPNHPNYYLGCDTTSGCACLTSLTPSPSPIERGVKVWPNPVGGDVLHIGYTLPQNKGGMFELIDVTGKVVFKYPLPPWSNEQSFDVGFLANGVYSCSITSGDLRVSAKVVVMK